MMNRMISYGYGYKDEKLIVVESEAEIVKGIFTDYLNGKILKEIADELTIKGIDFLMENAVGIRIWYSVSLKIRNISERTGILKLSHLNSMKRQMSGRAERQIGKHRYRGKRRN